jgi:hypothetical protein
LEIPPWAGLGSFRQWAVSRRSSKLFQLAFPDIRQPLNKHTPPRALVAKPRQKHNSGKRYRHLAAFSPVDIRCSEYFQLF